MFNLFVDQQKTLKFKRRIEVKLYTFTPRNTSRITMLGSICIVYKQIDNLLLTMNRNAIALKKTALLSSIAIIKTQENGFLTKEHN